MKKVVLYNPSLSTLNLGDEIIFDAVKKELAPLLEESFVVNVSTHLPVSYSYSRLLKDADERFVCGTNLLRNYFNLYFRQWDINVFNVKNLAPCVLVGVGWQKEQYKLSPYTSYLYKSIISKNKLHSVRDEYTKNRLEELGFKNVVNTGCPTMWRLTTDFCREIPVDKAENVVFTLTDYNRDPEKDLLAINELKKTYGKLYLWLQGIDDYKYAEELGILGQVELIGPSLNAYDAFLSTHDVDYIGTRLHGGIRALQHKKRTMILAVDGRATAKKADFNLPVVERSILDKNEIEKIVFDKRKTDIVIPEKEITKWKKSLGIM